MGNQKYGVRVLVKVFLEILKNKAINKIDRLLEMLAVFFVVNLC